MLKLPQGTGKNVIFDIIRRRYVALTEEWVRRHRPTFFLLTRYPQALMANEVLSTAERYKETLWYSALSTRPYRPDDCGIQGAWNRNHPKGFRPDYPLQHGAESGLSDCQQRASALLLSHRLRAQQLYFSAGYTRVSKLIGGATNSPLPLSSHRIIYHAWYAGDDVRIVLIRLVCPWRRRQCISGRREG